MQQIIDGEYDYRIIELFVEHNVDLMDFVSGNYKDIEPVYVVLADHLQVDSSNKSILHQLFNLLSYNKRFIRDLITTGQEKNASKRKGKLPKLNVTKNVSTVTTSYCPSKRRSRTSQFPSTSQVQSNDFENRGSKGDLSNRQKQESEILDKDNNLNELNRNRTSINTDYLSQNVEKENNEIHDTNKLLNFANENKTNEEIGQYSENEPSNLLREYSKLMPLYDSGFDVTEQAHLDYQKRINARANVPQYRENNKINNLADYWASFKGNEISDKNKYSNNRKDSQNRKETSQYSVFSESDKSNMLRFYSKIMPLYDSDFEPTDEVFSEYQKRINDRETINRNSETDRTFPVYKTTKPIPRNNEQEKPSTDGAIELTSGPSIENIRNSSNNKHFNSKFMTSSHLTNDYGKFKKMKLSNKNYFP